MALTGQEQSSYLGKVQAVGAAMQIRRVVAVFGVLLATALSSGCGGGGGASAPPPAPTITGVSVSPQNATVIQGQQQLFSATVTGTGNYSSAVTWSVNNVPGGNSTIGTISSSGNYIPPAIFSTAFTVTITAVSSADPTKSGSTQANVVFGVVSSVTIDPQTQSVYAGSNQLFIANVLGQGNVNPNVTWTVNGIAGGNSTVGTMSTGPGAFYYAPDVIPNPATVTLTATSVEDTTISGNAAVTVVAPPLGIISVSVSPGQVNMPSNQPQTFTATVIGVGNFNPAVTWSLGPGGTILSNYGSISPGGVYTPPNNLTAPSGINVTVTSVADPTKSATANVQVFPTPVITSLSPNSATAGEEVSINGTGLPPITSIEFTGPNNLTLTVPQYDPGAPVPFSTVSGPVWITTQLPGFAPVVSNSLQLTRIPALRIRAANRDLASGESTTFASHILGMPSAQSIQWTTDIGTIDGSGNYVAPAVSSDTFAHIQGCISGTQICQGEILGVHPFLITPYPASVALGGSLQLQSVTPGATWSELAGAGSLTPGGLYTAGTTTASSGGMPISATLNGATENATVGVTGGVPGAVSEISDYIDYTLALPLGTNNEQVAVSGTHLYALASGTLADYYDRTYFWIDVYDISDPIHPVWVDAVETALRGPMYTYGKYLYQVGTSAIETGVIAIFDISGTTPVLVAESAVPSLGNMTYYDGIVWSSSDSSDQITVEQYNLQGGSVVETDFQLPAPSGAGPSSTLSTVPMGTTTRLYAFTTLDAYTANQYSELDTFDLTTSPPTLLQVQPGTPPYYYAAFLGSFLVLGGEVFDLSSGLPVQVSTLPPPALGNLPLGFNGTQMLTGTLQNGLRVTNMSNLSQPQVTGVLIDRVETNTGVWSGQYVITGNVGIRVFDAGPTGGGMDKATPVAGAVAYDSLIYQSHLFEAIGADPSSFVSILDLTTNPVSEVSEFDTGTANPGAVQATGNTMYVGTDQSLLVVDISNPAAPTQTGSITGAVNALSIWGNYLYVGTTDGHLITYNIVQPASPVQVSTQTVPTAAIVMRASNNLLFIADNASGLLTYSLTNPGTPVMVSQFLSAGAVGDLALDGNLALLATADQGMVIADVTNPAQPLQVGQGILPAYGGIPASAMADGITLLNKVAYVGTWQDGGNVYGFDYSTAAYPRLVSVMPEGGQICDFVLTLQSNGTDLFDGGELDAFPFIDIDITQPDNVINYYPMFASAISSAQGNPCDDAAAKAAPLHRGRASYTSLRAALKKRSR